MNPKQRNRLILITVIVVCVGIAVTLAGIALKENINLFYNPTQIAAGEAPKNASFRVGGLVVEGSVRRNPGDLKVTFELTDGAEQVTVHFEGILPDLFREGQGIIAQGRLTAEGHVNAAEVLAKHDETYMPPEVQDALDKAGTKVDAATSTPTKGY
jgi:cytochrome c-type biogenesis protein CcmE